VVVVDEHRVSLLLPAVRGKGRATAMFAVMDGIGSGGGVGQEGRVEALLEDRGDRPIARCPMLMADGGMRLVALAAP